MKKLTIACITFFMGGLLLVSCATKSAPAQLSTSAPPKGAVYGIQDENWAKVVEAAKREGVVTAYSWHLTGDQGSAMISAFEKRYGIRVEVTSGPGTQLIERIKTEYAANQTSADVLTTATTILNLAKSQGLTRSVGDLPALRGSQDKWRVSPIADPPDSHIVGVSAVKNTAFVNTTRIPSGQEPKSYKDLLDPKWRGQIIEADPASDPNPNLLYYVFTSRNVLTKEYYDSLAKQKLIIAPQSLEKLQMLARGAGSIGLSMIDETVSAQIVKGAPIKALILSEGIVTGLASAISTLAKAPHPNAARVFIDWWLSPEGQETWGKAATATPLLASINSFVHPDARIETNNIIRSVMQDDIEASKLMRERTLAKILIAK